MNINFFMDKALDQANKAFALNEVPVGAVLVDNRTNNIISSSHNMVCTSDNATAHAEMLIIQHSIKERKDKFLNNTTIFVTLEPCAMCAAAISMMRIDKLYFGAYDEKKGSLESIMKIYNNKHFFLPEVYGGINEIKCSSILKKFFKDKRKK